MTIGEREAIHPDPTAEARAVRLRRWIFGTQLGVVGVGYLVYAMNRSAFPIGLSDLGKTLGFSALQIGTLATIFLLGQAVIDVPAGVMNYSRGKPGITHRINTMMLIGTAGAGVASLLLAFLAVNYPLTLAYRVLFGIFEGIFNICVYSFAGSVLPKRRAFLNTVMGFFFAAGSVIGPTAFGQIIASSDGDEGWRIGLGWFGGITVVLAVIMFVIILVTLRKTQGPTQQTDTAEEPDPSDASVKAAFRDVVRRIPMWKGLSIHAVNLISYWMFSGLMPTFLKQYQGMSVEFVGLLFGTAFGLTSLVSPLLGLLADKLGRRIVVVVLALVDAVGLYILLMHPPGEVMTFVIVFLIGVGLNTLYFTGYTLAQDGVPNNRVAIATGFAGAVGYLVASGAGPLSGWITGAWGYQAAGIVELVIPQLIVVVLAMMFLPGIREWKKQREMKAGLLVGEPEA